MKAVILSAFGQSPSAAVEVKEVARPTPGPVRGAAAAAAAAMATAACRQQLLTHTMFLACRARCWCA